jgi:hypothetical protein
MDRHDDNLGRKGIAYDWQSLDAARVADDLDAELAELLATPADRA